MNGQVSKRIRIASSVTKIPTKKLKQEYQILPYHRRNTPVIESHRTVLQRHKALNHG